MSLCARMLARIPTAATVNVVGRERALDASARGQSRTSGHDCATVNPLEINDFARFPERPSGAVGRQFLQPTGLAAPSEAIDGAAHTQRPAVENVRVHHTRTGMRARGRYSMVPIFVCSTSRYRNKIALSA
jgi:hypothetical protein